MDRTHTSEPKQRRVPGREHHVEALDILKRPKKLKLRECREMGANSDNIERAGNKESRFYSLGSG